MLICVNHCIVTLSAFPSLHARMVWFPPLDPHGNMETAAFQRQRMLRNPVAPAKNGLKRDFEASVALVSH